MPRVHVETYAAILARLSTLRDRLAELRLHKAYDRLGLYVRSIQDLQRAIAEGTVNRLAAERGNRRLTAALLHAAAFGSAAEALEKASDADIRRLMKRALRGPEDPIAETPKNSDGRNVEFELAIGGALHRSGAEVSWPDSPDVLAGFEKPILVECKRPFSPDSVDANIIDAAGQLTPLLNGSPSGARGLIAISVSRLVNPDLELCPADPEFTSLADRVATFAERSEKAWRRSIVDPRIVGVIFHSFLPAVIPVHPTLVLAQHAEIRKIDPNILLGGGADTPLLERLGEGFTTRE